MSDEVEGLDVCLKYWDLDECERNALSDAGLVGEDEHFVVSRINSGRRFLRDFIGRAEKWPPVGMEPRIDDVDECVVYDAIAALLFVGADQGLDPGALCADALHQFNSFMKTASVQARELRPHHMDASASAEPRPLLALVSNEGPRPVRGNRSSQP